MEKEEHWFVVQGRFMTIQMREDILKMSLRTFVPILTKPDKGGVIKRSHDTLLTFNYAFVYGEASAVLKEIEKNNLPLRMLYHRGDVKEKLEKNLPLDKNYMIVSDEEMDMFMRTVEMFQNGCVPMVEIDEKKLKKGDKVRVLSGPFEGVEGVLIAQQGKEGGKVVVSLSGIVSISTLDIEPSQLEVIEFASDTKHIYKRLDAYQPKIKEWASKTKNGEALTDEEKNRINRFISMYGKTAVESMNMEARLKVLLYLSYRAIGITPFANDLYHELREVILPQLKSKRVIDLITQNVQ